MSVPPVSRRDVRLFGLVMLGLGAFVAYHLRARGLALEPQLGTLAAGLVLCVFALVAPGPATPLYRAWMLLGRAIGFVTTPLVVALIFFLVVTPTALLLRLLGRDILGLRRDPSMTTHWVDRPRRAFERRDFERMA